MKANWRWIVLPQDDAGRITDDPFREDCQSWLCLLLHVAPSLCLYKLLFTDCLGVGVAFVKSNKQQLFNIVAAWGRDNSLDKQG